MVKKNYAQEWYNEVTEELEYIDSDIRDSMDEINFLTFKNELLTKDPVLKESFQEEFKEYQKEIISLKKDIEDMIQRKKNFITLEKRLQHYNNLN